MWKISQSWSLLALVCFVATPGTEALSFVEIQGPNFKGQLRYEVQRSKDACLSDCYLFEDCVIVAINTAVGTSYLHVDNNGNLIGDFSAFQRPQHFSVVAAAGECSFYAAGNDVISKNGEAFEIKRSSSYNSCEPKMTFPTPLPFTSTPENDGTAISNSGCALSPIYSCVNPQGMHFYARCGDPDVPKDLKKVCKIMFSGLGILDGCSSTSIYRLPSGRRLLLGDSYANSRAYSYTHVYSSSARCHAGNSICDRITLLREYRNTTLEDYLYLPEGIVDPQLQYTDMNIPIYAHQTDCTSSSTATGVDCLEDCNSLISQSVIGMVP